MITDPRTSKARGPDADILEGLPPERQSAEVELNRDDAVDDDSPLDPEDASPQDWAVADRARPDMIDETADGLDATEESVRHNAEDRPL